MALLLTRLVFPTITRLHRDEGQTMAEYAVLLGVIALVVVVAGALLGKSISAVISSVGHAL